MEVYTINADGVALVGGTAKTVLQLRTPSSRRARLVEWSVSFNGTNGADAPVLVELMRQSADGTGTSFTPLRHDPAAPSALSSAVVNFSAEPTVGEILYRLRLTPNGGLIVIPFSVIREERPVVPVSGAVGIRCTAAAAVNCTAYLVFEE